VISGQFTQQKTEPNCRVMWGKAAWIRTGKTRRAGGAVVKTGAQIMKTEGPGTEGAEVLVADVMYNAVLLSVDVMGIQMLGIVLPELGHQGMIQPLNKVIANAYRILMLRGEKMHSIHHSLIIFDGNCSDRLAVVTRRHLADVLEKCMWMVTVAGTKLHKDRCCDLLETWA